VISVRNRIAARLLAAFLFTMVGASNAHAQLKTIEDRLAEFGDVVWARLAPKFAAAGIEYPPARLTFVGVKQDRVLEVYGASVDGPMRFICSYPVLGASGQLGPKLKEGDRQVPEGVYRVRELNPNSLYHLSVWIDYPNEFDLARAAEEGRTEPGSEIMIHGGQGSRGCLAMGDPAAEDLFVLAALAGIEDVTMILAPADFRRVAFSPPNGTPPWTSELYAQIARELSAYPRDDSRDQVSSK
jgi:hypothetical protein